MDFGSPVLEVAATARGDLMLRLSNDAVFLRWNT
jgi:hypothetical protein